MALKKTTSVKQHQILVPTDFSEQTTIALEQACGVAKVTGADIVLINIIEDLGVFEKYFSKKEQFEMQITLEEKLKKLVDSHSRKYGVNITWRIE